MNDGWFMGAMVVDTASHMFVKHRNLSAFGRLLVWLTGRGEGRWVDVTGMDEGDMWVEDV